MGLEVEESQMQRRKASSWLDGLASPRRNPAVLLTMYGPVFKTSLVGRQVVVSTDPEVNHFVLQHEGRLFRSCYPNTFTEIFGRDNVGELQGFVYKYLKGLVLRLFGLENLREVMLQDMEKMARERLSLWSLQATIEIKDAISAGRKKAMAMLKKILAERMESTSKECDDFFDCVVKELKKDRPILTQGIALDLMFVLLFASFETTSLVLTLAVKLLSDHPQVLAKLTEEHGLILMNRRQQNSGITWKEYKSMKFTLQVINETIRLANIVPGIFRKALKDIHINGYTIPAGWGIMVCPPAVHLNPEIYEDPMNFNPWRWKDKPELSKHFMAFGGGMRFCVGTDFSKLQMAVFIHCLVTKYRWTHIRGGHIIRTPGLGFPDGYHLRLLPKE
ncbi:hypothetical protein HPP92_025322 [Vanilla planifolia]|uniref:Cytochrome P450 n=1 Tax=Vanilla planifolia TaxID=51239 RepID=A0A835PJW1_VANPL|nr:hypothetical protein HPP92_025322 [Vanilla planifolia]